MELPKTKFFGVRLSPNIDFELDNISKDLNMSKGKIVRIVLNDFIEKYRDRTGK